MAVDPRSKSKEPLTPPKPLPVLSRRALGRVKHPLPIPTDCPCCRGTRVELVNNAAIYNGVSHGDWPYAYLCRDCYAYVGLHPGTDLPLGTLADKPTRNARNTCKKPFERIWRSGLLERKTAYAWLAREMGLTAEQCHFGLFNIAMCAQARAICEAFLEDADVT